MNFFFFLICVLVVTAVCFLGYKNFKQILKAQTKSVFQVDEYVALTDPKLSLFTGEEEHAESYDDRPQHKLTLFRFKTVVELS